MQPRPDTSRLGMSAPSPSAQPPHPPNDAASLAGLTDAALVTVGSHLSSKVECAAGRFAAKTFHLGEGASSKTESWSPCEEAARLKILSRCLAEQGWVRAAARRAGARSWRSWRSCSHRACSRTCTLRAGTWVAGTKTTKARTRRRASRASTARA